MIKTWTFENKTYNSEWAVRQAIYNSTKTAFGEAPKEGLVEFWEALKVTYSEREYTQEEIDEIELSKAKQERAHKVATIKVQVGDKIFDGDEAAQSRMARAIQVAEISGLTQTEWVLANNEVAIVSLDEMREALSKAMLEMGKLWTMPYEQETRE